MESYRNRINEILNYEPKRPENRNGHRVGILFRIQMLSITLRAWKKDPVSEKQLMEQGYGDGIINDGDRNYPVRLLRELDELRKKYPTYFET